jgi:hypothetical protein
MTDGVAIGAEMMSDRQFIQTILNALTIKYANLIEKVEDNFDDGDVFTIEDLKEKLAAKYTRMKVWGKQERTEELQEHAVYNNEGTPSYYTDGFSGLCRNCGKRGHKSANCRDNNNNNNMHKNGNGPSRFKGKCFNCGKIGHRKIDCRAPKKMNDRANTVVDGRRKQHQDDIVLMAIEGGDFCPKVNDPMIECEDTVCNNHEWGMMTTEEIVIDLAEED